MKYKYIILGNIVAIAGIAAIATSGYNWKISIIFGVIAAIIGNYMAFDIWKKANETIKTVMDSVGGYVGLKFENGKVVKLKGDVDVEKLDEVLRE